MSERVVQALVKSGGVVNISQVRGDGEAVFILLYGTEFHAAANGCRDRRDAWLCCRELVPEFDSPESLRFGVISLRLGCEGLFGSVGSFLESRLDCLQLIR
jgi:hypothetical protein